MKWDGYRALANVSGGDATLTSRRGNDLTGASPVVARALERAVHTPDCVLDGEVCALDEEGRSSFSVMQQGSGPLVYYVFDVLEIDGSRCSTCLAERRKRLAKLLDRRGDTIRLSEAFDDGEALWPAPRPRASRGSWPRRPTRATSRAGGRATG